MTDTQALFTYRLRQAAETLRDAEKMLQNDLTPRSVINRAYYAMFYTVLALFISAGLNPKTSRIRKSMHFQSLPFRSGSPPNDEGGPSHPRRGARVTMFVTNY